MTQNIPNFIYGTAWKEAATTHLVELALKSGFVAIDTANQAKHYSEALVGEALLKSIDSGNISRDKIWLQSKFTSINGQDHRLPYDANASLTEQLQQSFASSLKHLHTNYLDSYLLHGPYNFPLLGEEDFEIWKALEELYSSGAVKSIGISNVNLRQLKMLVEKADILPMMVQNRCYANQLWDKEIREFCRSHNIKYQAFSLLTANPQILHNKIIAKIAQKYQASPAQIIFRFASQIGMIPLTGTSNKEHMKQDLAIFNFTLSDGEIELIFSC